MNSNVSDLQSIISAVDSLRVTLGPLPASGNFPILEVYEANAVLSKQIVYLKAAMEKASTYLNQYSGLLDRQHAQHTTIIKRILGESRESREVSGQTGQAAQTTNRRTPNQSQRANSQLVQPSQPTQPQQSFEFIEITPGVTLPAIVVTSFPQVQSGELYYVSSCDHFALKIGNKLLHGNIGTIFSTDREPEKVRDCRFLPCNNDPCTFYHDPLKHAGRKDRRCYLTNSWTYIPADSRRSNETRGRKLGNRTSLAADLAQCTPEEAARFRDQAFHDLLCSLLVA